MEDQMKIKILINWLLPKVIMSAIIRFSTLSNLKQIWMVPLVITTREEQNQAAVRSTMEEPIWLNRTMDMLRREQLAWREQTTMVWEVNSPNSLWMVIKLIWRPLSSPNNNSATVQFLTNTDRTVKMVTNLTLLTNNRDKRLLTNMAFRIVVDQTWLSRQTQQLLLKKTNQPKEIASVVIRPTNRKMSDELKTYLELVTSTSLRSWLLTSSFLNTKSKSL